MVLIPTTRARLSTSGPPELPGLSATSVCRMGSMRRPSCARMLRASALTTPAETVLLNPSGFPMATTSWPTRSDAELPSSACGRWVPSMRMTARSVAGSLPTSVAACSEPSVRVTRISRAPATTCALVSM